MRFPLAGTWFVAVAGTPHGAHRWALPEAFAYDIVALGAGNLSYKNKGQRFEDSTYALWMPVFAVADGTVRELSGEISASDPRRLRRPGEGFDAYAERSGESRRLCCTAATIALVGNSVLHRPRKWRIPVYARLKPRSAHAFRRRRTHALARNSPDRMARRFRTRRTPAPPFPSLRRARPARCGDWPAMATPLRYATAEESPSRSRSFIGQGATITGSVLVSDGGYTL